MRVRVTTIFRDKETHNVYKVGAECEFESARAKHLLALGLVEEITDPKPAKAEVEIKKEVSEEKEPVVEKPQPVVSERRRTRKSTK